MQILNEREKNINEFARLLTEMRAVDVVAIAQMLDVKLFYDDVKDDNGQPMPRSAESIIEDCLVKFYALGRRKRRFITKAMRQGAKANARAKKN